MKSQSLGHKLTLNAFFLLVPGQGMSGLKPSTLKQLGHIVPATGAGATVVQVGPPGALSTHATAETAVHIYIDI